MVPGFMQYDKFLKKSEVFPIFSALFNAYNEPHRFYHTYDHIYHMLSLFQKTVGDVWPELERDSDTESLFVFAIICHDLVYIPGFPGNEEASQNLALIYATMLGVSTENTTVLSALILYTKHNKDNFEWLCLKDASTRTKYIHDLDLAILGESYSVFKSYDENVKKEFLTAGCFPETFNTGRARFLEGLLQRKSIYITPYFQEHYEAKARENIENILKQYKKIEE